ncbi:MAG TPA: fused MFS/spermidine synthase [Rhizomicrobium sp.]|jgi:hypothetical protein|nr:fused MFS/spermidine synthase [Rhizomicrobium sp.]
MTSSSAHVIPHNPSVAPRRFALLAFPAAIFLSASLLFWVEPLFSKMVLPVLGGSSAVWSVAMVVFQGLMLAGYLYAHILTRYVTIRHAVLIHAIVLAVAALSLPISLASGFHTPPQDGLSLWLAALFLASIGLPFFALAANAPLLQAWFARGNSENAYLLYRASNLGSVLVLLAYPFLIEPSIGLAAQSRLWSIGYVVLVFAITASGAIALRTPALENLKPADLARAAIRWRDRLQWAALGFVPSGLLIAVTAHITTDVASGPYIWILPLALYLLTFVFAFSDRPLLSARAMLALQPFTTALLVILFLWGSKLNWILSLGGHLGAFFVAAMVCHTQLYRRRPAPQALTQFYAWLSLGGVLGGIFAALIAPAIFNAILEYPLLVFAALLVRPDIRKTGRAAWLQDLFFVAVLTGGLAAAAWMASTIAIYIVGIMALAAVMAFQGGAPARLLALAALLFAATSFYDPIEHVVLRARSFYAAYKVADLPSGKFRVLYHGTTAHGGERIRDDQGRPVATRPERLTYYYNGGPFDDGIQAVRKHAGGRFNRVAVIGLGVGALSCASQPGEAWTFYELDPMDAVIARDRSLFRSMSLCAPGAPVVIGDGRLTLHQARAGFDLLVLDVFSSDSVPLHMLTREAFALYESKLTPHGVIAVNVSNKNMELANAVAASAAANGMITAVNLDRHRNESTVTLHYPAEIALVARSADDMKALKLSPDWHIVHPAAETPVWTDDYSNVLSAILLKMRG